MKVVCHTVSLIMLVNTGVARSQDYKSQSVVAEARQAVGEMSRELRSIHLRIRKGFENALGEVVPDQEILFAMKGDLRYQREISLTVRFQDNSSAWTGSRLLHRNRVEASKRPDTKSRYKYWVQETDELHSKFQPIGNLQAVGLDFPLPVPGERVKCELWSGG